MRLMGINVFWLLCLLVPVFLFGVAVGRAIEIRENYRRGSKS